MKNILLLPALLLPLTAFSQLAAPRQPSLRLCHFEAEGNIYYSVSGAAPNAALSFYSDRGGGHVVGNEVAGSDGALLKKTGDHFHPAFVLGTDPSKKATGSKVAFAGERSFVFSRPVIERYGSRDEITWKMQRQAEGLSFLVLQSGDGLRYEAVQVIDCVSSAAYQGYRFEGKSNSGPAFYKIAIRDNDGTLYVSEALTAADAPLKLYPTVAATAVNIRFEDAVPDRT